MRPGSSSRDKVGVEGAVLVPDEVCPMSFDWQTTPLQSLVKREKIKGVM
jgi:hypothetical protein